MNKEKFIKDQINKKIRNLEKKILTLRDKEYIMLYDSKSESVPMAYNIEIGRLFVNMEYFMFKFFGITTDEEIRPWLSYFSQLFNSLTGYTPTENTSINTGISRGFYDIIKDLV